VCINWAILGRVRSDEDGIVQESHGGDEETGRGNEEEAGSSCIPTNNNTSYFEWEYSVVGHRERWRWGAEATGVVVDGRCNMPMSDLPPKEVQYASDPFTRG